MDRRMDSFGGLITFRAIPTRGVELMGKLDGKIAVVTGGNSGIGLAAAEAYRARLNA